MTIELSALSFFLLVFFSVFLGAVFGYIYHKRKAPITDGTLKQHNDPDDGTYLFVEFKKETDPLMIMNKKYAIFEVDTNDIISHE
jgi:uncharacterized membrane protein YpjA